MIPAGALEESSENAPENIPRETLEGNAVGIPGKVLVALRKQVLEYTSAPTNTI